MIGVTNRFINIPTDANIAELNHPQVYNGEIFLTSYLLLFLYVSAGLGSHFRGAIFMVRPSASGVNNELANYS